MPPHLFVENWEKCAGIRTIGTEESAPSFSCKPLIPPFDCPLDTWDQLYGSNGVADYFFDCQGQHITLASYSLRDSVCFDNKFDSVTTLFLELRCDLSWHEGIFHLQGVKGNGQNFYTYSPDYKLKRSRVNRVTQDELVNIGKIKKKAAALEASVEQMQNFVVPPVGKYQITDDQHNQILLRGLGRL